MAELKKCPFCGGEAEIISYYFKGTANRKHFFCQCKACGARKQNWNGYRTNAKAIEAWNNRATEAEIRASALDDFMARINKNTAIADFMREYLAEIAEQLKEEQE